ncbi:glutathione S-transferase [Legionella nautarum]|uniref:Glutathione S-transferase n=1 Tax=Legionella nautarum TaxID=45070 RepID=A0A0W0WKT8_9GAMM|nr:MAPEG family protein [Legionella nautarum]KTD32935.1 glutathione S-transferase [Legionella nautarum]
MYPITMLTASLLSFLYIIISMKIIKLRHQYRVSMGSGGNEHLERIIRAQANFAEYVPLSLILMLCAEANQVNLIILSILACILILGRLFHAYAFIFNKKHFKFRVRGMILTFTAIILLATLDILFLVFKFMLPNH